MVDYEYNNKEKEYIKKLEEYLNGFCFLFQDINKLEMTTQNWFYLGKVFGKFEILIERFIVEKESYHKKE